MDNSVLFHLNAEKLYAFRIEDGAKTEVRIEKNGGFALLYLDHFSYYVITLDKANVPSFGAAVCAFNGHSYTEKVTPPTCTVKGYTTHTCPSCGDTYTDSEVPAKGHTAGSWIIDQAATCKEQGSKHQECAVCHNTIATDTIAVDNTNHASYGTTLKNKVDAKCTAKGYTGDYVCNGCGKVVTKGSETAALGHTAPNSKGNCDRCGTHLKDVDSGSSTPAGACKYCGQVHTGPFGWLIKFFHSILALFGLRK